MMQFHQSQSGRHAIRHYAPGLLLIGDERFTSSLIITPDGYQLWPVTHHEELCAEVLAPVYSYQPDVIIVGTGAVQVFPPPERYLPLMQFGIGVELMDSAAAARTYNVLLTEGRRVAAAIIV